MPCHVMVPRAMPYFGVSWRVMNIPCHAVSGFFWKMDFEKMSKIYAHPLPRVHAIFLFAIEYSAKAQHTTTGARAPVRRPAPSAPLLLCVEPWLNTQRQTEK